MTGVLGAIEGVYVEPLRQIRDERGAVVHIMRLDPPPVVPVGEVYGSLVKAGAVKAWKRHRRMIQRIAVPVGEVEFVLYDDRECSTTHGAVQRILTGYERYARIHIPPLVWYGFRGVGPGDALIINCASLPHDPEEVDRVDVTDPRIPFAW